MADQQNVLYVVLHGLICLLDLGCTENKFLAYLLEMEDEHKYLYGNWLAEKAFPPRHKGQLALTASLTVESTPCDPSLNSVNTLDANLNAVAKGVQPPHICHPYARALICLPRPHRILYGGIGNLNTGSFSGNPDDVFVQTPSQLCGTRIFQYCFDDPNDVALVSSEGTRLWACPQISSLALVEGHRVAVLHIYDEPSHPFPDKKTADAHNVNEFNLSLKFLGQSIEMLQPPGAVLPLNKPIPGLYSGEIASLSKRELIVIKLMADVRSDTLDISHDGGTGGQVCSPAHGQV